MKSKWLNIKDSDGDILRIRKDKIVAVSLPDRGKEKGYEQIIIYIQTHVGRTIFNIGICRSGCYGYDYYLNEIEFGKLRAYLDKATRIKGELNLDPE